MIALFVALGGTAGAVVTAAVPLAKRALVADNAKKLNGVTAGQLGGAAVQLALKQSPAGPRPASTAAGLISSKTVPFSASPEAEQVVTASCDAGSKAVGGGFSNPTAALVVSAGSFATTGRGWMDRGSGQPELRRPPAVGPRRRDVHEVAVRRTAAGAP